MSTPTMNFQFFFTAPIHVHIYPQAQAQQQPGQMPQFFMPFMGAFPFFAPQGMSDAFDPILEQVLRASAAQAPRGPPPTSSSFITNLKPVHLDPAKHGDVDCAVCQDCVVDQSLSQPVSPEAEVLELPCGHLFHRGCILPWIEKHNTCPTCRYELPLDDPAEEAERQKRMAKRDADRAQHAPRPVSSLYTPSFYRNPIEWRSASPAQRLAALAQDVSHVEGVLSSTEESRVLRAHNEVLNQVLIQLDMIEAQELRAERRGLVLRTQALQKQIDGMLGEEEPQAVPASPCCADCGDDAELVVPMEEEEMTTCGKGVHDEQPSEIELD